MSLIDVLRRIASVRYIGWSNIVHSVRYGLQRDAVERGLPGDGAGPALAPGALQSSEATEDGARLTFEHASLEVTLRAEDLVRLTWRPGRLPLPYALAPDASWPAPTVESREDEGGGVRLTTPALTVRVGRAGAGELLGPNGEELRRDAPPELRGTSWRQRTRLRPEEVVLGLGERTAPLNVRPGAYRLWNREPKGRFGPETDPIYVSVPVWLSVHEAGSYLVFYENTHDGEVVLGEHADVRFAGGALRTWLVPGPPDRALARFGELTGRPPLPPRWALGFHQSRWSYRSEAEVRELVEGFAARDLPLDAVHLDIHYLNGYRVFTADPARFPDLPGLAADLAERGVRLVFILDPGVKHDPGYAVYRDGAARDAFLRWPDGSDLRPPVWPGPCGFPDFTSRSVRRWWGEQYAWLVEQGAAGVWHDMNEPAAFAAWGDPTLPRNVRHDCEGRGGDHVEAHNVYALQEARAAREALGALRPQQRPWILSRSGWVGLQRYAWTWTGDSESNWWSLAQSVRIALAMGLVGLPWTGPDIGGFGGDPSPELFVRWLQLGVLLPFCRVHSAAFAPRREPWLYGDEVLGIAREQLRFRRRLLPYLYTCAWQTSRTGHPLVRPLAWPDAADPGLWAVDDAFLLGDALLVAPVLEPGATSREVRLPPGRWYGLDDDAEVEGPGTVRLEAPLERIPVLARAGAVLPLAEGDATGLHVWPAAEGGGVLYRDAGDGYGASRVDRFRLTEDGETLRLERSREGAGPAADLRLRLHGVEATRVVVDGEEVEPDGALGDFRRVEVGT